MGFGDATLRRGTLICLLALAAAPAAAEDLRYPGPEPIQQAEPAEPQAAETVEPDVETVAKPEPRAQRRGPRVAAPPEPPRRPVEFARPAPALPAGAPPLTVRAETLTDPFQAVLTTRDILRRDRRPTPVLAAPTSLADRPAPARPSDKALVEETAQEQRVARVFAPPAAARDAPTTQEEVEFYQKQTDRVVTECFPDDLKRVLARMSRHFGSPVIVTSGYRSRGRRGSLHRVCKAADVQIAGVRPSQIVAFAENEPDIGGIGTYSYTRSIHIDTREAKMSWRGNRGRGWFRVAKDLSGAVAPGDASWLSRANAGGQSGSAGGQAGGGPNGGGHNGGGQGAGGQGGGGQGGGGAMR